MSLLDDIKNGIKKAGTNKGKIVYFKSGVKVRLRLLQELDTGLKILFHDSFELGVNYPCQEVYGKNCSGHEDENLRHRDNYAWSCWDYEAKEVKIIMGPANNYSPVPLLVGFYDTYGAITDRDYVITKNGAGTNQSWSVVPMDKVKFKNDKAKPYGEKKMLEIIGKAFPYDDEEEKPTKGKKGKGESKKPMKKQKESTEEKLEELEEEQLLAIVEALGIKGKVLKELQKAEIEEIIEAIMEFDVEDIEEQIEELENESEDEDEDEDEEEEESEYEEMSAVELYKLCVEKKIKVKPKKEKEFYIEKLKEVDENEW